MPPKQSVSRLMISQDSTLTSSKQNHLSEEAGQPSFGRACQTYQQRKLNALSNNDTQGSYLHDLMSAIVSVCTASPVVQSAHQRQRHAGWRQLTNGIAADVKRIRFGESNLDVGVVVTSKGCARMYHHTLQLIIILPFGVYICVRHRTGSLQGLCFLCFC